MVDHVVVTGPADVEVDGVPFGKDHEYAEPAAGEVPVTLNVAA